MEYMTIEFINAEEWGIDTNAFGVFIENINNEIDIFVGIINVIFVNDVYIQSLNKAYRKKDESTDVLSFNYQNDDNHESNLIGEIYISVETAKKQAPKYNNSFQEELNKLFVHGVLHIHGYDHENDGDYKKMFELEERVLSS